MSLLFTAYTQDIYMLNVINKCGSSELTIWAPALRARAVERRRGSGRRGPPGRPPQPPRLPRLRTHSPSGSSEEGPGSAVRHMCWAFSGAICRVTYSIFRMELLLEMAVCLLLMFRYRYVITETLCQNTKWTLNTNKHQFTFLTNKKTLRFKGYANADLRNSGT